MIKELELARTRLLDLTARNKLLNYRPHKIWTIEFQNHSVQSLFENLIEGERKMSFQSTQTEQEVIPLEFFETDDSDKTEEHLASISVNIRARNIQTKLHKINKQADSFFEEQGYSALFVAAGFIHWREQENGMLQKAPLILIPVELRRSSVGQPYKLKWTGDEVVSNVSIIEKAKDLDTDIPEFIYNGDLNEVGEYLQKIQQRISLANIGWAFDDKCCLDFFSFTKFVLWKDLDIRSWNDGNELLDNELIKTILLPPDNFQPLLNEFGDYNKELPPQDIYHILDADPSQIAVIEAVKKGENIVVEGPPGTGKSQTIANIIAELMGLGKSVLFVSEKMAALEVVKNRLEASGLGEFCLELHSRKTNKKEFINTLKNVFLDPNNNLPEIDMEAYDRLESQRNQLNRYAETIAQETGARRKTIFELISLKEEINRHFELIGRQYTSLPIPNASEITSIEWNQMIDDLNELTDHANRIPNFKDNPWMGTNPTFYFYDDIERFQKRLSQALKQWVDYSNILELLESQFGIVKQINICDLEKSIHAASIIVDMIFVGSKIVNNDMWRSHKKDPCNIIRYLHEYNNAKSTIQMEPEITTQEAEIKWNKIWPCINVIRNIQKCIRNLIDTTNLIYDGTVAKLQDFLNACNLFADSPFQDIDCLLNSKWSDLSVPKKLVELLSDAQAQYALAEKHFSPAFLKQNNLSAIESFDEYKDKKLRIFSSKYRAAKRVIKRNLIDKTAVKNANFPEQLSIAKEYYLRLNDLNKHDNDGKSLFDTNWQGLPSDVEKLTSIIEWQKEFSRLRNLGFFAADTYAQICKKQEDKRLKNRTDNLAEVFSNSNQDINNLMLSLGYTQNKAVTFSNLLAAAIGQLKFLRIAKINDTAKSLYGYLWNSVNTQEEVLISFSKWQSKFIIARSDGLLISKAIALLDSSINDTKDINKYYQILITYPDMIRDSADILKQLGFAEEKSNQMLSGTLSSHIECLKRWQAGFSSLSAWIDYLMSKNRIRNKQCLIFPEALEQGDIVSADDIVPLFKASYADTLLKAEFIQHEVLRFFNGDVHERKIEEFSKLDKRIIEINRQRLAFELRKKRQNLVTNTINHSETTFLNSQFNRRRAYKPIRQILSSAGNLIMTAKPCFMMSPLSIAQYLDPQKIKFDTIIFDEASQVRPEDALGALLRGRQLVVMGDSQQLPPSMFFAHLFDNNPNNDDNGIPDDTIVVADSILQQCRNKLPWKYLKWHYRSKHESLIQLSNSFFYNNRLQVFPSAFAKDQSIGLQFHHIPDTVYDRGENELEAKYVVDLACKHYQENPGVSLGIGAFSIYQQDAILNELEKRLNKNPELQVHFSKEKIEHFFVKNLETIQGDEREVIIISVGYGFDQNRQLHMNFGPLNQDRFGGDRRLNVLITRARQKCIVVCNFRHSDLRLADNSSRGLQALKAYLYYAELGEMPLDNNSPDTESPFEDSVYDFLSSSGYNVKKQVGCASYRIDLAITHPDDSSQYVLGIECDGAMYHSSRTARERDRLRQEVLERLGWKIYRIWSTDWYRNRQHSIAKLLEAVDLALQRPLI